MKKILFLLLLTSVSYGQAIAPTRVKITNNVISTTAPFINTQEADGFVNKINKIDVVEYLEFASAINLPVTGVAGKIYLTRDNNILYRWNGTIYVPITVDISGKENTANKQNSLVVDGVGVKYPTVDATNAGLTLKKNKDVKTSKGLLIGDSTIAPYEGQLGINSFLLTDSDITNGTTITNQAVPGATINDQKATWLADVNKGMYDWIVVQIGLNDVGFFESDSQIMARYQSLIDAIILHKKTNAVIIVATMLPAKKRWVSSFGSVNGALAQTQWENINIAIMGGGLNKIINVNQRVDNHTFALSDGEGNLANVYDTGDGIHENNKGRSIIANSWRVSINKAGFLNDINPFVFDNYFNNFGKTVTTKADRFSVGTTSNPLPVTFQSDIVNLPFYRDISSNLLLKGAVAGVVMESATGLSGLFDYDNKFVFYAKNGAGSVLAEDFRIEINQLTDAISFNVNGVQKLQVNTNGINVNGNQLFSNGGTLKIGSNLNYGKISVSDNTSIMDAHSLDFYDVITSSSTGLGYGVIDVSSVLSGTTNNDHFHAYQARHKYTSSGTLGSMNGYLYAVTNNGGVIENARGLHITDVLGTGGVVNNYGLDIANLYKGSSNNIAIKTRVGKVLLGDDTTVSGNGFFQKQLLVNGSTANDAQFAVTNASANGYGAFLKGGNATNFALKVESFSGIPIINAIVGQVQVNGTITASPATLSNQVVVKSQLDAITNNINLTGTPTAPTPTAGSNGLQIANKDYVLANGVRPYKVFTALLSQTGTAAPVATVLENTLGGAIFWSRTNTGSYLGTLNTAFVLNKTFCSVTLSGIGLSTPNNGYFSTITRNSNDQIILFNANQGNLSDIFTNSSIEIRVYN